MMEEEADTATATADVVAGSFFSTVSIWGNGSDCPCFLHQIIRCGRFASAEGYVLRESEFAR